MGCGVSRSKLLLLASPRRCSTTVTAFVVTHAIRTRSGGRSVLSRDGTWPLSGLRRLCRGVRGDCSQRSTRLGWHIGLDVWDFTRRARMPADRYDHRGTLRVGA